MEFNVKIQKTDVKIYDVNVSIKYEELVEYVNNSHMSFSEYLDDCCFDEDTGEVDPSKSDFTEEEFYKNHMEEYIGNCDVDLMFTDNCHNHSKYELQSEECEFIQAEEIN
jgi:hypothetical protein